MADRRMDSGRDDARSTSRTGIPENGTGVLAGSEGTTRGIDVSKRGADVAPPGSRERAESDISGYNPDRDEDPSLRQGRFHRAAALRLAQPRTSTDFSAGMGRGTGMGMSGMGTGAGLPGGYSSARSGMMAPEDRGEGLRSSDWGGRSQGGLSQGPYGRDDRDERYATGMGGQMRMGDQDLRHSLETRRDTGGENYRTWDRTGHNAEERQLREDRGQYSGRPSGNPGPSGTQGQYGHQVQYEGRYDPLLGMGQASPGEPGRGVNIGRSETYTARGSELEGRRMGGRSRRWQREPLTARDIMTRGVKTLRRDNSLREVAQLMKDEDCGVIPIVDDKGALVGVVTDRDLVIRAFTGGKAPDQLRVSDVMTDDVECVQPDEDIHSIIELMGKKQVRRIPVVEKDDRVIGIVSMGDIAHRADYDEELQEALDRISSKRSFWSRLT